MPPATPPAISFARLSEIAPERIAAHMSDARIARHMPLLTDAWNREAAVRFVADKETYWHRDGLGHWAILCDGAYAGWGGFQREGEDWDFGLVLTPERFGLGARISRQALEFARADPRIDAVTFLLAPSRTALRGLTRLGAVFVGETNHGGARFLKYRLATGGAPG